MVAEITLFMCTKCTQCYRERYECEAHERRCKSLGDPPSTSSDAKKRRVDDEETPDSDDVVPHFPPGRKLNDFLREQLTNDAGSTSKTADPNAPVQIPMSVPIPRSCDNFVCYVCRLKFPTVEARAEHDATIHKDRKFRCSVCGKAFAKSNARWTHERTVCGGERRFECHVCHKRYGVVHNRNAHVWKIHDKDFMPPIDGT